MKNFSFFLVLLVTFSILYLVYKEYTEGFTIPIEQKSIVNQELAEQLNVDIGRIKNFKEFGDQNDEQQYKISFDLYPRNIAQQNQPLVTEIEKNLKKRQIDKKFFKITTPLGQDVFLSKIHFKVKDIIDKQKEAEKQKQFINPAYKGQINYLKDKERGIKRDISLERSYNFKNGELVLESEPTTIPTQTSTPTPTHPLTNETTVPTMSFIA